MLPGRPPADGQGPVRRTAVGRRHPVVHRGDAAIVTPSRAFSPSVVEVAQVDLAQVVGESISLRDRKVAVVVAVPQPLAVLVPVAAPSARSHIHALFIDSVSAAALYGTLHVAAELAATGMPGLKLGLVRSWQDPGRDRRTSHHSRWVSTRGPRAA